MTAARAASRILLVTTMAVLATAGCAQPEGPKLGDPSSEAAGNLTGPAVGTKLDTVTEGKLTACTAVPDAPFALEADGELDGIDIELVRAVAGRLGLSPTFVTTDAGAVFDGLAAKKCDIVASSVTITEQRRTTHDVSVAYFRVDQSLLVHSADRSRYPDLASLAGRTVGVLGSSRGAGYAKANAKGATVTEFPGTDELLNALASGRVDAALQDHPVNAYDATRTGETVVVETFRDSGDEEYGFAMGKGRSELKAAIDGALAQVSSDDTYPTILRRFLGDTAGQL